MTFYESSIGGGTGPLTSFKNFPSGRSDAYPSILHATPQNVYQNFHPGFQETKCTNYELWMIIMNICLGLTPIPTEVY